MRLLTGPPFNEKKDCEYSKLLENFQGKKVICGGTTANIISRELKRKIKTNLKQRNIGLPPVSEMDDIDMVTEGILTLTETARYLESGEKTETSNYVKQLVDIFHESDIIEFYVGTRINEAHQDPNFPVDLEMRRNVIKRIIIYLENNLLKKTILKYI